MRKKEPYLSPETEQIKIDTELSICAMSTNSIPDYTESDYEW